MLIMYLEMLNIYSKMFYMYKENLRCVRKKIGNQNQYFKDSNHVFVEY